MALSPVAILARCRVDRRRDAQAVRPRVSFATLCDLCDPILVYMENHCSDRK